MWFQIFEVNHIQSNAINELLMNSITAGVFKLNILYWYLNSLDVIDKGNIAFDFVTDSVLFLAPWGLTPQYYFKINLIEKKHIFIINLKWNN